MVLAVAFVWASTWNDYPLVPHSAERTALVLARAALTLLSAVVLVLVQKTHSPATLDRVVSVWVVATVVAKFFVLARRPSGYFGYVPADFVCLLLAPLALPIPLRAQLASMFAFATEDGVIALFYRAHLDMPTFAARVASYVFAMSLGAFGAYRIHVMMRRQFRALSEEVAEREALVSAMAELRTLRGILPMCAQCHKIRDAEGRWRPVDVYVRDHTHAEFSHGFCPVCFELLYPELIHLQRDR